MKLPFVVADELRDQDVERYHRHIDSDASGWHRRFTESIWRRHQAPSNAALSGWTGPESRKRRLVHFWDEYGLEGRAFVLRHPYLHLDFTLPEPDLEAYRVAILDGLREGGWSRATGEAGEERFVRGDLVASLRHRLAHPKDVEHGAPPPAAYRNLGVVVRSAAMTVPAGWEGRPLDVFHRVGLRKTLSRGTPREITPEELADHFPAQLELGCGPSIEAGIPHLSTLHRIYGVSKASYGFVFTPKEDGLLDLFRDPEGKMREMTAIYRACLLSGQTPFYEKMKDLWDRGHLVGPVITNNFDCQCADLGLPEISLRRYDWGPYYPRIEHDPRAKSLLVVGVHADRRLVQMRARERGLRVLFVDPERYVAPDGSTIPYPVEAPQDADFFVRATAHDAFERLHAALVR